MSTVTTQSESLRAAIARHRGVLDHAPLRGDEPAAVPVGCPRRRDVRQRHRPAVDLLPSGGNELLRVSGIAEGLSELVGSRVEVVAASLLRGEVSSSALADAVAV